MSFPHAVTRPEKMDGILRAESVHGGEMSVSGAANKASVPSLSETAFATRCQERPDAQCVSVGVAGLRYQNRHAEREGVRA